MKCNAVTFTASDGASVTLPLDFLIEKGAVVANKVNGEDLLSVMGAANQLWIPGLPAKYFVRDIVGIRFTQEEEIPVIASFVDDGRDFVNRPNVSVKAEYTGRVGVPIVFEGWADDYDRRIAAVQFSLDGGATWTEYPTDGADAVRWVYWRFEYLPEKEGSYTIKVRSVNDEGDASPVAATHSFEVLPSF